ncbi:hypothetical protein [Luteolibacter sp. LG18]|uniref:hypothetical protein n=1 Tax=Luteolibacter sp. LG18 TaxID=2819286 RepID=UPI002B2E6138|nr:hypothetical protein llg_41530 [Luteolibacter sp. LG18]
MSGLPYWYEGEPDRFQTPPEGPNDGFPEDKDVSLPPKGSDQGAKDRDSLTSSGGWAWGRKWDEKR